MNYIGTTLSGCLLSMMCKEVSFEEVIVIVTGTGASTFEKYVAVVEAYYDRDNRHSYKYNARLGDFPREEVLSLANHLYETGKIHQPRNFLPSSSAGYRIPFPNDSEIWLEIVPTNQCSRPAVVEAYEKYKMLDTLYK
jgi:hypothetical protein